MRCLGDSVMLSIDDDTLWQVFETWRCCAILLNMLALVLVVD